MLQFYSLIFILNYRSIPLDETLGAFVFGSVGLRLINDFAEFGWSHIVQNLDIDKITKNLLYQREGV